MAKVANIFIDGEIWPEEYIWDGDHATSLYRVRQQIEAAGTFDRIKLNIFSPGGYCVEGWAIVDYLISLGFPIDTLAYGQCASFGTVFHSMGEVREISQHCDYVVHRPWDWFMGNDLQNDDFGAALKKETLKLFTHYSERIGMSVEDLGALIQKEDLRLSPEETIEKGFSTTIWQPSAAASTRLSALDSRKKKPSYHLSLKDRKPNPNAPKDAKPAGLQSSNQNNMAKFRQSLIDAANSVLAFMNGTEIKNLDNKLKDGRTLVTDSTGDKPAIGDSATIDGTTAADADYELESGVIVTVKDGEVSDVKDNTDEEDGAEDSSIDPVDSTVDQPTDTPEIKALRKELRETKTKAQASDTKYEGLEAKYNALEKRVSSVLGAMSSQDPKTQSNRPPKEGNRNTDTQLSDREQMLASHVEKYKYVPREEVTA